MWHWDQIKNQLGSSRKDGHFQIPSFEDVGDVSAHDATEDIGSGKSSFIEKSRDIVAGDIEIAEAVKEIDSAAWPAPARDVELGLATGEVNRGGHCRVEAGWRNRLSQGDRARDGKK